MNTAANHNAGGEVAGLRLDLEKASGEIRLEIERVRTDVAVVKADIRWIRWLGGAVLLAQLAALAKLFWPAA